MEKEDNTLHRPDALEVTKIFDKMILYVNKETPYVELPYPSLITVDMYSDSDDILSLKVDLGCALNIYDTSILEKMVNAEYFREVTKEVNRGFKYTMSKSSDKGTNNVKALFIKIEKKYKKEMMEKENNILQQMPDALEVTKIFDKMILYVNKETPLVELSYPSLITVEKYSNSDDILSLNVDLGCALNIDDTHILDSMNDKKYFTDIIRKLPSTFNYSMSQYIDKGDSDSRPLFIKISQ
jgi:hypothetical protein